MARITMFDLNLQVETLNDLLADSKRHVKVSSRNGYTYIDPINRQNEDRFDAIFAGSKRECYDYIVAMKRGIEYYNDR